METLPQTGHHSHRTGTLVSRMARSIAAKLHLTAVLAGLALATGDSACADESGFKDWTADCNNVRTCVVASGSFQTDGRSFGLIKIARAGSRDAKASVTLDLESIDEQTRPLGRRVTVQIDALAPKGLEPFTGGVRDGDRRATLSPAQTKVLLATAMDGAAFKFVDGDVTATVSLSGLKAALRWMDDQQHRVGTVTALVARGARPASAVPAPPPTPRIVVLGPVSQAGLHPQRWAAARARAAARCEQPDFGRKYNNPPVLARLSPGVVLWGISCWIGSNYNQPYSLFISDEVGHHSRPARGGPADEDGDFENATFDAATATLTTTELGRGIGDCGGKNLWGWNGRRFVRLESLLMGRCELMGQDDWPSVYHAKVIRRTQSGAPTTKPRPAPP